MLITELNVKFYMSDFVDEYLHKPIYGNMLLYSI